MESSTKSLSDLADATIALEQAVAGVKKLIKQNVLSAAAGKRNIQALQKQHALAVAAALGKKVKGAAPGGPGAPLDGAEDGDQSGPRPWPGGGGVKTLEAQTYTTWKEGIDAVKAAFQDSTLYQSVSDCMAAATERCKKHPGGAGVPARGQLDWEFNDGTLGCR